MASKPIRILLIEDNPDDAVLLRQTLSKAVSSAQIDLSHVERLSDAFARLDRESFDLVLAYLTLPDSLGLDTLLRLRVRAPDVPVIVLTGSEDEELGTRAVQSGAQDYLPKGTFDGGLLVRAVRYAIERHRLQSALEESLRKERERQVEAVQRKSAQRMKSLVNHLPEGVCMLDREYRLVLANPAARRTLPALADVAEGQVVTRLGNRPIEEILAPDGPREISSMGPTDRIFDLDVSRITEGETEGGWVLVVREITEDRQRQEKIQQQYRLAAIGQLAAGIAHDFNNLLTAIMGTAQLLEWKASLSPAVREDLKNISHQGQQAAQLIRQILDFSRKTVAAREPLGLVPFLKEAVKLLRRTLPETIRIAFDSGGENLCVNASPSQLQQVITNLAVNARDAMPRGGDLRIGLSSVHLTPDHPVPMPGMGPGDWVVWTVSDTGAGMPLHVQKRIFEPFFTTKTPGAGVGLGLAQVYGIVKQHGGEITVETAPGKGTTFTLYLPGISPPRSGAETEETFPPQGQGETVLVVEDQASVRFTLQRMLDRLNYRVLVAANGRKALELYARNQDDIALVLTDVVMPGLGGLELVETLREINPEIRVILMTGYPLGEGGASGMPEGIAGFLEKPLELDRLGKALHEAVRHGGS